MRDVCNSGSVVYKDRGGGLKSYFLCLIASSILSGAVCMAAEGSGFEKHIRYVCSLVCIVVTITPIVRLSIDMPELPAAAEYEVSDGGDAVVAVAEENAREYISGLIMKKFGISCTGVCIDLYSEANSLIVTGLRVFIQSGDAAAVEKYLEETIGGTVEVIYDGTD